MLFVQLTNPVTPVKVYLYILGSRGTLTARRSNHVTSNGDWLENRLRGFTLMRLQCKCCKHNSVGLVVMGGGEYFS